MSNGTDTQGAADHTGFEIAIVGMAGRFPGAPDIQTFWSNLENGVESISFFSDAELRDAGIPDRVLAQPDYIRARAYLEDADQFDAAFFGMYAREAEVLDPQQRIFLECAWQALEDAGHDPETYDGLIGVFGGVSMNTYLYEYLLDGSDATAAQLYQLAIGNDKDFLASRLSYKLNLKGPSVVVQTACSTSLVAVHLACQSLQNYNCDMALAGGVSITFPQRRGYRYQEGMILSPDGHCRAFDADAAGTVSGDGAGLVALKRLSDALDARDHIYAVIRGSAINNDGSLRAGYTAPSARGQSEAIALAQAVAGVTPDTISYIEAHGTGTPIGDPIEIEALDAVFGAETDRARFCAIGSLKTNIGHLDTAAGVAGLIKTALALEHRKIPPSLHFNKPNPRIPFERTAFYVNDALADWPRGTTPRRAGVSSFGIGGTNAHVVLEEAPEAAATDQPSTWQLLSLSAKSPTALDAASARLARHLDEPNATLADVAYTLHTGRRAFEYRRALTCRTTREAQEALRQPASAAVVTGRAREDASVAFLFPGQGSQHVRMARDLYREEAIFREQLDHCSALLEPHLGLQLTALLYPAGDAEAPTLDLTETRLAQPALFAIEYALAQLLRHWGVEPSAMLGHSIGEYVAASLAGVFSLEDALAVVAERGRLMQAMLPGAMLSVAAAESTIRPLLASDLSIAAVNAANSCVVAGPIPTVEDLVAQLTRRGIAHRTLKTSHAFHSAMMEPVRDQLLRVLERTPLNAPAVPYVSNLTGTWITSEQATSPAYYGEQLRNTVRFADGVKALAERAPVLLEVGPGQALTRLARRQIDADRTVLGAMRQPLEDGDDRECLLCALARLWTLGVGVDWARFHAHERRRRVSLPTYPFERERYWPAAQSRARADQHGSRLRGNTDSAAQMLLPSWARVDLPHGGAPQIDADQRWLLFVDDRGVGERLARTLARAGADVTTVTPAEEFAAVSARAYRLNPSRPAEHDELFRRLGDGQRLPDRIVHAWNLGPGLDPRGAVRFVADSLTLAYYSVLHVAQAIAKLPAHDCRLFVLTSGVHDVSGAETLRPERSLALGPCKVIGQEYPHVRSRHIDFEDDPALDEAAIARVLADLVSDASDPTIAWRGRHRWVQTFEPLPLVPEHDRRTQLRKHGVYLITGGLGRIGLALAEHLARTVQARIVLTGRSAFPEPDTWVRWLDEHDEEDAIARKIRALQRIEAAGARVFVHRVDAADEAQMRALISTINESIGPINGVIHCAGLVGEDSLRPLNETDAQVSDAQFAAKVRGLIVLEAVLRDIAPDFCALQSSLSSILGGLGFTAYAAANNYVDAFARHLAGETTTRWVSIDWDGWSLDTAAALEGIEVPTQLARASLEPDEAVAQFERIVTQCGYPQVLVAAGDLRTRIDAWLGAGHEPTADAPARHGRASLSTEFVAPETELQRGVAAAFEELLGISPVGLNDDFFEMGGDSLLATQLVSQLRDRYAVDLPLRELFGEPTVAGAERVIRAARASAEESNDVAALLQRVQSMSEEDAQALLMQTRSVSGRGAD